MLINSDNSALLVIDIQEKLLPALHDGATFMRNSHWLISIAGELEIPMLVTEQYPEGLGATDASLLPLLESAQVMRKEHFSVTEEPHILNALNEKDKEQLVLIGAESHVCLLQSAIGLSEQGYDVFVVTDAIRSRNPSDYDAALIRLQQNGIQLVSKEMVAYEWLKKCNTDQFRHISRNWLREKL
ncbi:hydrolase [Oceanospirillum sediminis]|uniref:Hydrolase n=1 Tax=Oceanospirillum sediminis TaxID=2760088 RepID=A0A839IMI2_9GAMM|nr:hydrolase [Oceanospirillum sediminis]MBB1486623.1 hydrolase [Oceanospirillum sediminis]